MRFIPSVAAATLLVAVGSAHAQSNVTVYGRIDTTVGKAIGSDALVMTNGSGSRLGFRGVEDLGGGLSAFFTLEHRFNADTGAQTEALRFFRQSYVGLRGRWGSLQLGRDYTPAFIDTMVTADPWGNSTVANFTTIVTGGISPIRLDDQVKYRFATGPFAAAAMVSIDRNTAPMAPYPERPVSFSAVYSQDELRAAYGYENPGNRNDYWHTANVNYKFGPVEAHAFYGTGETTAGRDRRAWMLGAIIPVGRGDIYLGHGRLKEDSAAGTLQARTGIGYYHALSKRTTVYVDVGYDSKAATRKTGFDVGLRHNF